MEWWHWVLGILASCLAFFFGSGALTVAAFVAKAFLGLQHGLYGVRDELSGIRGDVRVLANDVRSGFEQGEKRFEQVEARQNKHSVNIADIQGRLTRIEAAQKRNDS